MSNTFFNRAFLFTLCVLSVSVIFAQPGGSPVGGLTPTPLDGGIGILLGTGAVIGYQKIKKSLKKKDQKNEE